MNTTQEYRGVMVRYLRALTGIDAWHHLKGFTGSLQGAEAFVYDREEGLVANLMTNFAVDDESTS